MQRSESGFGTLPYGSLDIGDTNGDVMKAFTAFGYEPRDRRVFSERLQQFETRLADMNDERFDAMLCYYFAMSGCPERTEDFKPLRQIVHRNSDVVDMGGRVGQRLY